MKIVCIADTHNKHKELTIEEGDLIIHAGDFTEAGTKAETLEFLNWFSKLPHQFKILVPGNHDFFLERNLADLKEIIPPGIHCLIDSGVTIKNIKFWGSPYIPGEGSWAFMKSRGMEIREHWKKIPEDTNFLITHTPPYGLLDELDSGQKVGCEELFKILGGLNLSHHLFGHIHHEYGVVRTRETLYINASLLDDRHRIINTPLILHRLSS